MQMDSTTERPPSVLLLEDEEPCARRVEAVCQALGWGFEWCKDQHSFLDNALRGGHDVVVLDRMMGDGSDALDAIDRLRDGECSVPTIVLSSIGESLERTRGFDAGADIYLTKPFEDHELVAAVGALLRRHGFGKRTAPLFNFGRLELRRNSYTANWDGKELELSPQSFEILEILATARGECVRRADLWKRVWPGWVGEPQNTLIDQAIFRLRRELRKTTDDVAVMTRRRRGYFIELRA